MKVSVFTPLSESGNKYIRQAYESLVAQTYTDWEWIVLENHGGRLPSDIEADPRVRRYRTEINGVGALKRAACARASGDVLLELDHDDLLTPYCLREVVAEFERGADFVYSDFAEFKDGTWEPNPYSKLYGWQSYAWTSDAPVSATLLAMVAPEDPIAWRRIEWAPNHLRAWRKEFYDALPGVSYPATPGATIAPFVGGHDASLHFADDHDLVLRTLLHGGKCVRIPQCLYLYRVHESNNTRTRNAQIQELEAKVYDRHIYQLAEHQARQRGLMLVDLCGAHGCPAHYTPIDRFPTEGRSGNYLTQGDSITHVAPGCCMVADLDRRWPLADSSVGVLRAFDAIEHLRNPVHTMNEAHRVLAPGGVMLVSVPSTDGKGAWCDPTHVSFWNDLSFRYYTDDRFRRYVPSVTARFQVARLRNLTGAVPYVQAELIALKDGYEPMGKVDC